MLSLFRHPYIFLTLTLLFRGQVKVVGVPYVAMLVHHRTIKVGVFDRETCLALRVFVQCSDVV